jgi:putative tricarboxylic transport membrane protein
MAKIRHPKDLAAGLMFTGFGVAAIAIGHGYPLGVAARMGAGDFPRILGILLIVLGAVLVLRALRLDSARITLESPRPLLIVIGSVVLFGFTAPTLGLVIASILLIFVSSIASTEFRWKEALISGVVLAALSVAGFIWGLGLQFSVWPTFLGLGFVLGPLLEENLRRAMLLTRGDPTVFFTRPLSLVMLLLAGFLLLVIVAPQFRRTREEAFQESEA